MRCDCVMQPSLVRNSDRGCCLTGVGRVGQSTSQAIPTFFMRIVTDKQEIDLAACCGRGCESEVSVVVQQSLGGETYVSVDVHEQVLRVYPRGAAYQFAWPRRPALSLYA